MEFYKYLGLTAIGLIWIGLCFQLFRWPGNSSMTLSQHAAQSRAGQVYYFFLFLITLPSLFLFFVKWFIPAFNLSLGFMIVISFSILAQAAAALFPEVENTAAIHRVSAFVMACLMVPMVALVGLSGEVSHIVRILAFATVIYQVGLLGRLISIKGQHKNLLQLQISYLALSHLVIAGATVIS